MVNLTRPSLFASGFQAFYTIFWSFRICAVTFRVNENGVGTVQKLDRLQRILFFDDRLLIYKLLVNYY